MVANKIKQIQKEFPGETKNQFENTIKLAKDIGWAVANIGIYLARPGTVSFQNFSDDILRELKSRRFHILDNLINKLKTNVQVLA